jgi:hypothetical protein
MELQNATLFGNRAFTDISKVSIEMK